MLIYAVLYESDTCSPWLIDQAARLARREGRHAASLFPLSVRFFYLFLLFFFVIYNQGKGKFFEPITIQIDFSKSPN